VLPCFRQLPCFVVDFLIVFTARRSSASAVVGTVILSVCSTVYNMRFLLTYDDSSSPSSSSSWHKISIHSPTDHLTFYSAQRLDLFAWCVRLSRLLVGFRTHFKSLHFLSFFLTIQKKTSAIGTGQKLMAYTRAGL